MKQIIFSNDKYNMNWLRQDYTYGDVKVPENLEIYTEHSQQKDLFRTKITFRNTGKVPVFTTLKDISVAFPLEDRYEGSEICIPRRCHTHIFCGDDISYLMALRMGGEAPHLGMVVINGGLGAYSVERDLSKISNDRGCFLLHPTPMEILPGEERVLEWVIFPHGGREDFYEKVLSFRRFVKAEAESYVLYKGESAKIRVSVNFPVKSVTIMGQTVEANSSGEFIYIYTPQVSGEQKIDIQVGDIHTWCCIYVQEPLKELAERRCHFIAEHQQYHGAFPGLQGAYLVYDNEEDHIYYSDVYDYNGGRERVGMGMLLIEYLKETEDAVLKKSLGEYTEYILRELVDIRTGEVCNDIGYDNQYERLYNWPWYASYFAELYCLERKKEYLEYACKILEGFYKNGGRSFYPIELPVYKLLKILGKVGMDAEKEQMLALFKEHGDSLLEIGIHYPPSEVNYEQSIVAPAADILLQIYMVTEDVKYLEGARKQMEILDLFHGIQPDYHLYETAIRHWDGYWFGKRKLYGDTYPHYWSAVTGNVYVLYYKITGDKVYKKKAKDIIRGVLPMFFADGRASCAYVYPLFVNGTMGAFWDPYANDQDWGLYYNLRLKTWLGEEDD